MTTLSLDVLDRVRVARPCPMRWEDLEGDGCVRHCRACDLDVYNFSDMTRDEIARVLATAEGRLCAGFYRRADGTLIARDCPVGVRAWRRRMRRMTARMAAAIALLACSLAGASRGERGKMRQVEPFSSVGNLVGAPAVTPPGGGFVMGDIMVAPPPSAGRPSGARSTPNGEG